MIRRLATLSLATSLLFGGAAFAQQDWPNKPIRLIVPYAPGGAGDLSFRPILPALEEKLGQRFVIENKPGASGNIGAAEVMRAAPDGYTLLLAGGNNFVSNQYLYRKMSFDPLAVFDLIVLLSNSPTVVVANPGLPVNSLRELAAYAKANPGKLNFPSPGVGTPPQLSGEFFSALAGVKMVHIPFNGSPPAVLALQQNEVQVAFYTLGPIAPLIRGAKVKALAVAATTRLASLPDVPTVTEALPGYEATVFFGLHVPTGTPQPVIEKIFEFGSGAINTPVVQERLKADILFPIAARPEVYANRIKVEVERWNKVMK